MRNDLLVSDENKAINALIHDLKNNLMSIKGYLYILNRQTTDEKTVADIRKKIDIAISAVAKQADEIGKLVTKLR